MFPPISRHLVRVREMPCIVSFRPEVTLHHCHGGSVLERGYMAGMGMKQSDALVIPLHEEYHTGNLGIDRIGVLTWERMFRTQVELLEIVSDYLEYDVWEYERWLKQR